MGKIALGALVVGALLLSASSTSAVTITMKGIGAQSCGTWVESYSPPMLVWVQGFLSHGAHARQGNILADVGHEAINVWIDNYCRAHPLDLISTAAFELELELAARVAPKAAKP
jgi:hypothetical protein